MVRLLGGQVEEKQKQRNPEAVYPCPVVAHGGTTTEATFAVSSPALYGPPPTHEWSPLKPHKRSE